MRHHPRAVGRWAAAGLLAAVGLTGLGPLAGDEELLRIEASLRPKSLSRSEEGVVVLRVMIRPDLTISPHPSFTIELAPCRELVFPKSFYTHSDLNMGILEKDGRQYLDIRKPIEIPFTVSLEAKRGSHILEGKIKYFARSDAEGWCLKNTARFAIPFFTRQTVAAKRRTGD